MDSYLERERERAKKQFHINLGNFHHRNLALKASGIELEQKVVTTST